jgi:DNA-binding transcriptional LysR family regulator
MKRMASCCHRISCLDDSFLPGKYAGEPVLLAGRLPGTFTGPLAVGKESADGRREFKLPDGRFKVSAPDAMAAVQAGMGIGALPPLAIRSMLRSGALVRVLPEYRHQPLNIFAIYASRQYLDAKIKTWIASFASHEKLF